MRGPMLTAPIRTVHVFTDSCHVAGQLMQLSADSTDHLADSYSDLHLC